MELRFLGPLEVCREGRVVPLGGPKQRLVLAHLLLHANRTVTAGHLAEEIWGEEPPPTARGTLQAYISHLRKVLGTDRIVSQGQGYRLRAEPDELDGWRFEALARQARSVLAADPQRAAALLGEALTLWRGPPFADLAEESSLAVESARLEELRVSVVEDRIDAELALGREAEVVGELGTLTAAHPLRERLWGQLMLALYRTGRQAEALAAFERARQRLAQDLGIDPATELQQLHRRILRQDPVLRRGGAGGYALIERLGQGPRGIVWRATQPGTSSEVAVRVLHPDLADSPELIRRFDAEAQLVARLDHPHVAPLLDHWREPHAAYLVTRYFPEGSLQALLTSSGAPEPAVAGRIATQLAEALAAAHHDAVAHGRIRASNVFLDPDGNAYLGDFDVAGARQPAVRGAAPDSTSAPARPDGGDAARVADVRALGFLLGELLPDPTRLAREVIERATTNDPAAGYPDAEALLAGVRRAWSSTADAGPSTAASTTADPAPQIGQPLLRNPYKGLRPFTEADSSDFFGRDALTADLLTRLRGDGPSGRFLAVVGPSGSGKSSVVRAGLLPAVRAGALPGSASWFDVLLTPGSRPFEALDTALQGITAGSSAGLGASGRDAAGLVRAAAHILPPGNAELLVVVDQLEELFTLTTDDAERERFLEVLAGAATLPGSRVRVVTTLRADFYDRPLLHPQLAPVLAGGLVSVLPLRAEELEQAVTGPAERVGVVVEPGAAAQMVADVADQPGALPLLQYALTELFERRRSARLSSAAYREIGGVSGALARRAEETFAGLSPGAQQAARELLLRLVTLGEGMEDTRRRVDRSDVESLVPDPADMTAAIAAFGRARLLSFDRNPTSRAPTVEVAHEALLREWRRLRSWIDGARDDLRTRARLAEAVLDWEEAGRDASFLIAGARLEQIEAWRGRADLALTPAESAFLTASLAERDRRRAAEEERAARERALERRSLRRLRGLVALFAVAALVAGGLTVVATEQTRRASQQARIANARGLAAAAVGEVGIDPDRAILLALAAVEETRAVDGTALPEAVAALHRTLRGSRIVYQVPEAGSSLSISADGARFAVNDEADGSASVRETETGAEIVTVTAPEGRITSVGLSADGRLLGTAGEDGTVRVWDADDGAELHILEGHAGPAWGVRFSPDGTRVATTGADGTVRLWDMATGEQQMELTGHDLDVLSPRFSPDGSRLATAGRAGEAMIWDLATGEATVVVDHDGDWPISGVAFSPDGMSFATVSHDGTSRIWDAASGALRTTLHADGILVSVDFSPDGTRLVTGGADSMARVWDVATGREEQVLAGHTSVISVSFTGDVDEVLTAGPDAAGGSTRLWDVSVGGARDWLTEASAPWASGVAFSPDGERFASAAEPSGASIRETATGDDLLALDDDGEEVIDVAFSPDGSMLAASDGDGAVRLWDAGTGELRRTLAASAKPTLDVDFNADGSRLLSGGDDGRARLWDTATGRLGHQVDVGHPIWAVALSPDGRRAVITGEDSNHSVWDLSTGDRVHHLDGHADDTDVNGAVYGPDGWFATSALDATLRIWDAATGEPLRTIQADAPLERVAISADGTLLAAGTYAGTIELWDTRTGRHVLELGGHDELVVGVAFSPDGRLLATTGEDGRVAVHLLPVDELVDLARERTTRRLTDAECRQHLRQERCEPAVP
jgi:WD40 repeat protein/DNA-binding SARP family transcriptional activator